MLKAFHSSNFIIKVIKSQTIISKKQNFENKAFYMGFMHLKIKMKEKFKMRTKIIKNPFHTSYQELAHKTLLRLKKTLNGKV